MRKTGLSLLLAALLLAGCAPAERVPAQEQTRDLMSGPTQQAETPAVPDGAPEAAPLELEPAADAQGRAMLGVSPEAFADAVRAALGPDGGVLTAPVDWQRLQACTPCFGTQAVQLRFSRDDTAASEPTLSLYVPENGAGVYEIVLRFDDHGYQQRLCDWYGVLCRAALSAVLPEDVDAAALYDTLYAHALEPEAARGLGPAMPDRLWVCGGVGVYGAYGAGTVELGILPADEDTLSRLQQAGTELAVPETDT